MNLVSIMMFADEELQADEEQRRFSTTEYIDGSRIKAWEERLIPWIFTTYPETELSVQSVNPELRRYYMNVMCNIVEKLYHKPTLSDAELRRSWENLAYLTQAGVKVEWLWSQLEVKKREERKKRDACEARIVELKQELKKLELTKSGLKAELKNEKAKLNPRSFRNLLGNFFCLKTA